MHWAPSIKGLLEEKLRDKFVMRENNGLCAVLSESVVTFVKLNLEYIYIFVPNTLRMKNKSYKTYRELKQYILSPKIDITHVKNKSFYNNLIILVSFLLNVIKQPFLSKFTPV